MTRHMGLFVPKGNTIAHETEKKFTNTKGKEEKTILRN